MLETLTSETFRPDTEGPAAIRIDRQTYSDLKEAAHKIMKYGFMYPFPVETDVDPYDKNFDPDQAKLILQIVRISDEYLDTLSKIGFDIERILTPERLETYKLNKKKN